MLVYAACFIMVIGNGVAGAVTLQTNEVDFNVVNPNKPVVRITSLNFVWDNRYAVTAGQPWQGVSVAGGNTALLKVTVKAGRQNSTPPATFFQSNAKAAKGTLTYSDTPSQLNFAITGTLYINGAGYPVVIGQGQHGADNNWWIGNNGSYDSNFSSADTRFPGVVTADGKFIISTSGSTSGTTNASVFYVLHYEK